MYLENLKSGLLGALQAQNSPEGYLQQREQARAQQTADVQNQYAQAMQQGKANMAQLGAQEDQMQQSAQQQIKQAEAEEAKQRQQLMSIGLMLATGGMGGGAEAAGAAEGAGAAAAGAGAATAGAEALTATTPGLMEGLSTPMVTEGASVLGNTAAQGATQAVANGAGNKFWNQFKKPLLQNPLFQKAMINAAGR